MEIVPAIEVKNGQSLWATHPRAAQPHLKITDPLRVAARWKEEGATRIHLVDVDGSRVGMPQNRDVIRDLIRRVGLPVSISGGIPTADAADRMYTMGVDRVVVDVGVVSGSELVEMLHRHPDKIAIEVKVLDGRWVPGGRPGAEIPIKGAVMKLKSIGARRVVLRPVDKMDAPVAVPLEIASQLTTLPHLKVVIRSDVSSPQELAAYDGAGIEGVILGKALYDNKINLSGK